MKMGIQPEFIEFMNRIIPLLPTKVGNTTVEYIVFDDATGVRICGLPFTPERVYRALHGKGEKLYLKPENAA